MPYRGERGVRFVVGVRLIIDVTNTIYIKILGTGIG